MNILVIRFTALGDLVTLEPMFRAIRFFHQDATIDFMTSGLGKGLFSDTNYFDNYFVHKSYQEDIKQLREKEYDLIINLHCNSLSHTLALFSKKKRVVNSAANLFQKLIGKKVPVLPIEKTLEKCGVTKAQLTNYFQDESNRIVQLPAVSEIIIESDQPLVAVSTGSSAPWPSKQWGVDKYAALIGRLLEDGIKVILVGTHLELNDSKKIKEKYQEVNSFVDQTNLTQLKGLLKQASVYVGNDSGPSHIAAAVQTNTVTIFGPTSTVHCVKHMPYSGEHICIKPSEEISCHPCYKGVCPTQHECMQNIDVNEVYLAVKGVLK